MTGHACLLLWLLAPLLALADDDALAKRGRALYHGHEAYARGVDTTPLRLPVDMAACARCHGAVGEGGREGGQPVPALRWSALSRARAGLPAFATESAVLRAITQGHGRGGAVLDVAMPRFALQPDESRALGAYLRRIGTGLDQPPGVRDDRVRFGTVVPLSGPGADSGEAIAAGLRAGFAEANARGGVHGRHIELDVQDARGGVRAALATWRAQPVYALVGGLWNEATEAADVALQQAHLSHVATLVVREAAPRRDDWSADLLAPLALQREALAAALRGCPGARLAAAHGDLAGAPADAKLRWLPPQADLAGELRRAQAGCVGYTLARAAAVQGALPAQSAAWTQTLVLPMPGAVLQAAAEGERPGSPWYRLGLLAARLSTELLSRAGRQLHERALLDQLDRLPELELSAGVQMHFGRQRRYAWSPLVVPLSAGATRPTPITPAMASRGGG